MKKFLAVIMMILGLGITACDAKVTDPADPRFDPDQFSFSDYGKDKGMTHAESYKKLFPPGTPKEFVDRVLVRAGGAKIEGYETRSENNSFKRVFYRHPPNGPKGGPKTWITYDKENKLINMNNLYSGKETTNDR